MMSTFSSAGPESNSGSATLGSLVALAAGAAGVGFAAYVLLVPLNKVGRDLKRSQGELMAARADAAGRDKELQQARAALDELEEKSGEAIGRSRSQLASLSAEVESALAKATLPSPGGVEIAGRRLLVRLDGDGLFDGAGDKLSGDGATLLRDLAKAIAEAGRVTVTAPMGAGRVPPTLLGTYPKPADLGAARVTAVTTALGKSGPDEQHVWGVTAGGPEGARSEPAAIVLEIEP
jgi:hypothetical protein